MKTSKCESLLPWTSPVLGIRIPVGSLGGSPLLSQAPAGGQSRPGAERVAVWEQGLEAGGCGVGRQARQGGAVSCGLLWSTLVSEVTVSAIPEAS